MEQRSKAATRTEGDSFGSMEVPLNALWGAQTQRSLTHFNISTELMPGPLLMAFAQVKRAAAVVNCRLGLLDTARSDAIEQAASEVLAGQFADQFPLKIWQTGSGTQTNMNFNEVLAHRARQLLVLGRRDAVVHPNDHVNLGQSSNDVFPTAMHVGAVLVLNQQVMPALHTLTETLKAKSSAFATIIKVGRTHLQDATPITLGQEISGWVAQLDQARDAIIHNSAELLELAIGGTAVGTGLNTHPKFGLGVAAYLSETNDIAFRCASNPFAALAAHDAVVRVHGALKSLAVALMKIANDIRWLASGPRCGLAEIILPANEPGSSIMPGKVNPTQCEALMMVSCQVMGNDVALSIGGAMGNFELNVFKPLIAYNFFQSTRLLGDALTCFDKYCAQGIEANHAQIEMFLQKSLMLATALSPHIGYDEASKIAHLAYRDGLSLRAAALTLGLVTPDQFDQWVQPHKMV